jgi:hypothetical protein
MMDIGSPEAREKLCISGRTMSRSIRSAKLRVMAVLQTDRLLLGYH